MLLIAWFPHQYYKLSLGAQDQSAIILEKFINERKIIFEKGPITNRTVGQLRMELFDWLNESENNIGTLLDYVPYRLLTPFYSIELRGVPEHNKNEKIRELANKNITDNIPLYHFTNDTIQVDVIWCEYIQKNIKLIEGWAKWNWSEYLQNRNPSVPAVQKKILPILQRLSMTNEIGYWRDIMEHQELRCIYSGNVLETFELDHFLPWTFVAHNQLWNLIPVTKTANSSKSNNLPDMDQYFNRFIEEQFDAIKTSKEIYTENKWQKIMQPYISDLHITSYDDLLDQTILDTAYRSIIMPLYEIAKTNGFSSDWAYRESKTLVFHDDNIITEEEKFVSCLPFYPIEIAAGNFSESSIVDTPERWVDVSNIDGITILSNDLFVSQVHGHSMEPLIPNDSYCLFKYGVVGSRNNRVVLVKKDGIIDPDLQTSFTVKRYFSKKISSSEFDWEHDEIELRPDNKEYPILKIEPEDTLDVFVVAEFIQVVL